MDAALQQARAPSRPGLCHTPMIILLTTTTAASAATSATATITTATTKLGRVGAVLRVRLRYLYAAARPNTATVRHTLA